MVSVLVQIWKWKMRWKWKMSSCLLLCCPIARALRHWEGALAVAMHAPSSFLGWERCPLLLRRKRKYHLIVVSVVFSFDFITPFLLLCCLIACPLRGWEGTLAVATRTPSSFLGWEKGTLSSGEKENTIWLLFLCCLFLWLLLLLLDCCVVSSCACWGAEKAPLL